MTADRFEEICEARGSLVLIFPHLHGKICRLLSQLHVDRRCLGDMKIAEAQVNLSRTRCKIKPDTDKAICALVETDVLQGADEIVNPNLDARFTIHARLDLASLSHTAELTAFD